MTILVAEDVQVVPSRRPSSASLWVGTAIVGAIAATALLSFVWLPYGRDDTSGGRLEGPSWTHLFGTDKLGRDTLTQVMVGARVALAVGLGTVAIALVVGATIGFVAAVAPRWVDDTIASALDVGIAFPTLLLAMLLVAARGPSLATAILAIGLAGASVVARLTRSLTEQTLSQQYVTAARIAGTRTLGVLRHHVVPNIWPFLAVNLSLQFGLAVLAEASLSYLGLGAPPPNPSWGKLMFDARATVLTSPAGALAPGIATVLLVIGANLVADGLKSRLDPAAASR